MKPLTQYGQMAEKHWRTFRPKMVAELPAQNQLQAMLLAAADQTEMELDQLRRKLIQQGATRGFQIHRGMAAPLPLRVESRRHPLGFGHAP